MSDFKFFAGSSNLPLAQKVANGLGIKLAKAEIDHFSNNETRVRIAEEVKDKTCFLLQSLSTPTDENWAETLFFIDAFKRNRAKKIIGILPWIGYQKQDKAFRSGEAISVAVVIKTLETMGMDRIVTVDLHNPRILNYFQNPPIVLSAFPLFLEEIKEMVAQDTSDGGRLNDREAMTPPRWKSNYVMVAPDKGAYWTSDFAKKLKIGFVQMDKTRDKVTAKVSEKLTIHGDVNAKTAIIIDDNIYTGSTLILSAKALKDKGAKKVICFVTHAVLSANAPKLLQESEIDSLTVTDTIFVPEEKQFPKLRIISTAGILASYLSSMILTTHVRVKYQR